MTESPFTTQVTTVYFGCDSYIKINKLGYLQSGPHNPTTTNRIVHKISMDNYDQHKARILQLLNAPTTPTTTAAATNVKSEHQLKDNSPKGSLDLPTKALVHLLNTIPDYVTTSSCSGRIVLYAQQERKWLYVKHELCKSTEIITISQDYFQTTTSTITTTQEPVLLMKTEPFILHVLCRNVAAAQLLLQLSRDVGFRESGISVGKKNIICAIRTTGNSMEVPITATLSKHVTHLTFLSNYANDLFVKNKMKTDLFQQKIVECFINTSKMTAEAKEEQEDDIEKKEADRPILPLRLKRWGHATTVWKSVTATGKVERAVVMGGYAHDAAGKVSRRADVLVSNTNLETWYQPASSSSSVSSSSSTNASLIVTPPPRVRHTLTALGNNQFLLYGGRSNPSTPMSKVYLLELLNRKDNAISKALFSCKWMYVTENKKYTNEEKDNDQTIDNMCSGRWSHTATYDTNKEVVWIYGGRNGTKVFTDIFCLKIDDVIESSDDEMEDTPKKNGEIQNVVKTVRRIGMKRTSGNPPKTGRFSHTTSLVGSNLMVVGGCTALSGEMHNDDGVTDDTNTLSSLYIFDTDSYCWSVVQVNLNGGGIGGSSGGLLGCYSHDSILLTDKKSKTTKLLVLGGVRSTPSTSKGIDNNMDNNIDNSSVVAYDVSKFMTATSSLFRSSNRSLTVSCSIYSQICQNDRNGKNPENENLENEKMKNVLLCRHSAVQVDDQIYTIGGGSEVLSFGACFSTPSILKFTLSTSTTTSTTTTTTTTTANSKEKQKDNNKNQLLITPVTITIPKKENNEKQSKSKRNNSSNPNNNIPDVLVPVLYTSPKHVRSIKIYLETNNLLNKNYRISKMSKTKMAIPLNNKIISNSSTDIEIQALVNNMNGAMEMKITYDVVSSTTFKQAKLKLLKSGSDNNRTKVSKKRKRRIFGKHLVVLIFLFLLSTIVVRLSHCLRNLLSTSQNHLQTSSFVFNVI